MYDYMIVGAGFAGATMARLIAEELGKKVLIVDRRQHIGGNAYDYYNDAGILVHKYGPHIFHTNSEKVFQFLSRFTEWRPYEHRVLASVEGQLVPLPINLDTVNQLYGTHFNSFELKKYFDSVRRTDSNVQNSRDVIVNKVGDELYEKFFKNYTYKQWGLGPQDLEPSVCSRVPIRLNRDNRYFTDKYQMMPKHGYTNMFQRILEHSNIHIMLGVDFQDIRTLFPQTKLIYTGPIDSYFNYSMGKLPYRSVQFEIITTKESSDCHAGNKKLPVGTINFPNDYDYTRITEMRHLTGQIHEFTSIAYEYPTSEGEPYYPIPTRENQNLADEYAAMAQKESNTIFLGRLATYKYYNMDQVVAQTLSTFEKLINHS